MKRIQVLAVISVLLVGNIFSLPLGEDDTEADLDQKDQSDEVKRPALLVHSVDMDDQQDDDDDDDDDELDTCPICWDDFLEEAPLVLVCNHKFHFKCLAEFERLNGNAKKCFFCQGELRTKDNEDLVEMFRAQEHEELLVNKMKIGMLAGSAIKPIYWKLLPSNLREPGIYQCQDENWRFLPRRLDV